MRIFERHSSPILRGIIQQVFHQSLPNGKLSDDLTIKVIEEDPFTHYIVVPSHSDEAMPCEIPEEEQLELLVNLGDASKFRKSFDAKRRAQSTDERKPSLTEKLYKQKEQTKEEEYTSDPRSREAPLGSKKLLDGKVPDGHKIERLYDKPDLHHLVLRPSLPDQLQTSKEELNLINKASELGCDHGTDSPNSQKCLTPNNAGGSACCAAPAA